MPGQEIPFKVIPRSCENVWRNDSLVADGTEHEIMPEHIAP
jgi:hypothetical protein